MRAAVGFAAMFVAASAWAQALDIAGWGTTRWGMNAEQLKATLGPALIAEPNQIGLIRYSLKDGAIGGVPFAVQLLVNPIGLTDVVFGSGFVNQPRQAEADAVEAAMRAQYGNEPAVIYKDNATPDGGRSLYRELTWRFPSTNVRFLHNLEISAAGTSDHLSVTFSRAR